MRSTDQQPQSSNMSKTRSNYDSTKHTRNPKESEKSIKNSISKNNRRIFSTWELQVYNQLKKSNIEFSIKERRFPLHDDGMPENIYVPDFILKNCRFKNKRIIIEAHENLTDLDIVCFGLFMKKFKDSHHLIMIVHSNQLRTWNETYYSKYPLFHDIWTVDDLNYFIKSLDKYIDDKIHNVELPDIAECPKCGKTSQGTKTIEKLFGYRTMKNGITITQSYCKTCRNTKIKPINKILEDQIVDNQLSISITRYCYECKNQFITKLATQSHCNICLEKFGLL